MFERLKSRFHYENQTDGRTDDLQHVDRSIQLGILLFGKWRVVSYEKKREEEATLNLYHWCENEIKSHVEAANSPAV